MGIDKFKSDDEVIEILDAALEADEYPTKTQEFVEFREYHRQTRMVFLWVSSLFTQEELSYLTEYMRQNLHKRTVIGVVQSDHYFDREKEIN